MIRVGVGLGLGLWVGADGGGGVLSTLGRTWVATLRLLASSAAVSSDLLSPRKNCIIESSKRLTLRCQKGILIRVFQHASAEAILLCFEIPLRERAVRVAESVVDAGHPRWW